MLIEIRAKNCLAFDENVIFSMKADMRTKKFITNVHQRKSVNILKAAGIYGANNAGKTCLVKCIKYIRNVILHEKTMIRSNIFSNNDMVELGVSFLHDNIEYKYDFKYKTTDYEYVYERFSKVNTDKYGNESETVLILRDVLEGKYSCESDELKKILPLMARNNILIYLIDSNSFDEIDEMKKILLSFANKIEIVDMNNIPISKTIEILKNRSETQKRVVDFIKNADLYLDDYTYLEKNSFVIKDKDGEERPAEEVLNVNDRIIDQFKLVSVYKGIAVPSLLFDSTGTKKIAALASYIIETISEGKVLVIDEMDSSIHFKLSRAIVAMFNNELNTNAQLIFTVHDISLMDCKKLFRKEQIWFVHKDNEGVYLYSLSQFTAEDGIRDTIDIKEKYRKGILGAVPNPELINSLLDIKTVSRRNTNE